MYFVYILTCSDKTLYVGSTNDLPRRLHAHNHLKSGAHYTKIRRPVKLAYSEKVTTFAKARAREAEIKRLARSEKLGLIKKNKFKAVEWFTLNKLPEPLHSQFPTFLKLYKDKL